MTEQLQELYDFLELNYSGTADDLIISEPNRDEEVDYICCDQKIIHYKNEVFHITDLYDAHPCFEFKTKEEVLAFYEGYSEGYHLYFDTPEDAARAVGKMSSIVGVMEMEEVKSGYKKAISPIQRLYKLDNNEDKE